MKKCIKSRDLNSRITFENEVKVSDGIGGSTTSWALYANRWAKVVAVSGSQKWRADRLETNVSHLITIRYDAAVHDEMRIVFDSREFSIIYIINKDEGQKRYMEIHCVEGGVQ